MPAWEENSQKKNECNTDISILSVDHRLIHRPKDQDEMRREDQEKAAFRKNDMEAYITARTRLRADIKEVKLEETQHKDRLQAIQDISPVWYHYYKLSSFAGRGHRSWTSGWLKNDQGGRSQQKR